MIKILLSSCLSLLFFSQAKAQDTQTIIKAIDSYVAEIDASKDLIEGRGSGITPFDDSGVPYQVFNLSDQKTRKLLRSTYSAANVILTYYYGQHKLVYVSIETESRENGQYKKELKQRVYYKDGEVLHNDVMTDKEQDPVSIYLEAMEYRKYVQGG